MPALTLPSAEVKDSCDLDGFGYNGHLYSKAPPGMLVPRNPYCLEPNDENLDWPTREAAPSLPRITLHPSQVKFIEMFPNGVEEVAPSAVFRVKIDGQGERVLKIFRGGVKHYYKGRNFIREANAYAAFLQNGLCAAGVVPLCYGWAAIDQTKWPIDVSNDWLAHFRQETKPMRAIVLEYLPNASRMTLRWATAKTTRDAMNGLDLIHQAGVLHVDTHPRNLLVLPEGRVVWVDFECSDVSWSRPIKRSSILTEKAYTWYWMYQILLPWKWCALRNFGSQDPSDLAELAALEHDLIEKGCVISSGDCRVIS